MEDNEGKKRKSRKKNKKKREYTYVQLSVFFSLWLLLEESESPKLSVKDVASLKKKTPFFSFFFLQKGTLLLSS